MEWWTATAVTELARGDVVSLDRAALRAFHAGEVDAVDWQEVLDGSLTVLYADKVPKEAPTIAIVSFERKQWATMAPWTRVLRLKTPHERGAGPQGRRGRRPAACASSDS